MKGNNDIKPAAPPNELVVNQSALEQELEELELQLTDHREKMVEAKTKHESDMTEARELRLRLAAVERDTLNSNYVQLADQESGIMNLIQNVKAQIGGIGRKGFHAK